MPTRFLLAVTPILLFAGWLPAQYGVNPPVVRPLVFNPSLMPPGAALTNDITIQNIGNSSAFVGVAFQTSIASQPQARAFDYNGNTLTARPDFNSLPVGIDSLSVSPDLLNVAVYQLGVGQRMFQRNSISAPFGTGQPILGLDQSAYGLKFCTIGGRLVLLALFHDPLHSPVETYDFDPLTNSVSNPVHFNPPLGHPANFPAFAIPMNDSLGETRGLVVAIRQPIGFNERLLFTPGVDGQAPFMDWLTPPPNTFFVKGAQLGGGHLVGVNSLGFGTLVAGTIDMVGAFTFRAKGSALGGSMTMTAMGPRGGIGVFAIATTLVAPVSVPGVLNQFGVGGVLATFVQPMPDGVLRTNLGYGPTTPFILPTQSASYDAQSATPGWSTGNTMEMEFWW
ncbi:MAG: hypothetical protein U1E73_11595 [Planctomycetota bacterium]